MKNFKNTKLGEKTNKILLIDKNQINSYQKIIDILYCQKEFFALQIHLYLMYQLNELFVRQTVD